MSGGAGYVISAHTLKEIIVQVLSWPSFSSSSSGKVEGGGEEHGHEGGKKSFHAFLAAQLPEDVAIGLTMTYVQVISKERWKKIKKTQAV